MNGLSLGNQVAAFNTSVCLVLGITLIFAGLEKVRGLTNFVTGVKNYQILPDRLARWYGRLLPFVEIGAGVLLFSGIWVRPAAAVSAALMGS